MLSSGEITLDLRESVREADVYIIKCVWLPWPCLCARRPNAVARWWDLDLLSTSRPRDNG